MMRRRWFVKNRQAVKEEKKVETSINPAASFELVNKSNRRKDKKNKSSTARAVEAPSKEQPQSQEQRDEISGSADREPSKVPERDKAPLKTHADFFLHSMSLEEEELAKTLGNKNTVNVSRASSSNRCASPEPTTTSHADFILSTLSQEQEQQALVAVLSAVEALKAKSQDAVSNLAQIVSAIDSIEESPDSSDGRAMVSVLPKSDAPSIPNYVEADEDGDDDIVSNENNTLTYQSMTAGERLTRFAGCMVPMALVGGCAGDELKTTESVDAEIAAATKAQKKTKDKKKVHGKAKREDKSEPPKAPLDKLVDTMEDQIKGVFGESGELGNRPRHAKSSAVQGSPSGSTAPESDVEEEAAPSVPAQEEEQGMSDDSVTELETPAAPVAISTTEAKAMEDMIRAQREMGLGSRMRLEVVKEEEEKQLLEMKTTSKSEDMTVSFDSLSKSNSRTVVRSMTKDSLNAIDEHAEQEDDQAKEQKLETVDELVSQTGKKNKKAADSSKKSKRGNRLFKGGGKPWKTKMQFSSKAKNMDAAVDTESDAEVNQPKPEEKTPEPSVQEQMLPPHPPQAKKNILDEKKSQIETDHSLEELPTTESTVSVESIVEKLKLYNEANRSGSLDETDGFLKKLESDKATSRKEASPNTRGHEEGRLAETQSGSTDSYDMNPIPKDTPTSQPSPVENKEVIGGVVDESGTAEKARKEGRGRKKKSRTAVDGKPPRPARRATGEKNLNPVIVSSTSRDSDSAFSNKSARSKNSDAGSKTKKKTRRNNSMDTASSKSSQSSSDSIAKHQDKQQEEPPLSVGADSPATVEPSDRKTKRRFAGGKRSEQTQEKGGRRRLKGFLRSAVGQKSNNNNTQTIDNASGPANHSNEMNLDDKTGSKAAENTRSASPVEDVPQKTSSAANDSESDCFSGVVSSEEDDKDIVPDADTNQLVLSVKQVRSSAIEITTADSMDSELASALLEQSSSRLTEVSSMGADSMMDEEVDASSWKVSVLDGDTWNAAIDLLGISRVMGCECQDDTSQTTPVNAQFFDNAMTDSARHVMSPWWNDERRSRRKPSSRKSRSRHSYSAYDRN